jgi:phosphoribosyl 1,2-cyclic phosphate phosphodiesterase
LTAGAARVTFLGTGTSHGVPMIGCGCRVCTSVDPRDQRWRPSIAIEIEGGPTLLVDTSPDLRAQALRFGLGRVDAVLFTHPHADHLLGLDDIRRYNSLQRSAIPCYGDPGTIDEVRRVFAYAFAPAQHGGGVPQLRLFPMTGPCSFGRVTVTPLPVLHGRLPIYGYRVGSFAYVTDCSAIPDDSWPLLEGVRTLAIDALRDRPHPTHFTVAQALDVVGRLRPERALLTHLCHDLGHAETSARLPPGVEVAYDGLVLEID